MATLSKIMTFAIILETPVPDKSQVKEILLNRGYNLKHYDLGLMVAYDKDGKKIENKLASDPPSIEKYSKNDMYQLKGKYCNVDFSRDNPIILYKFGEKLEQIQHNLAENLEEIHSIIKILNQFADYGDSECELLVVLGVKGIQNSDMTVMNLQKMQTDEFVVKDMDEIFSKQKDIHSKMRQERLTRFPPPSPAENLEVHYNGTVDCKSKITESIIRARDEKYVITLRFETTGTGNALHDLTRCEEFGLKIIEKLESVSNLE